MAYTEAQWNRIQTSMPAEDRVPYLEYLRSADPAAYRQLTGAPAVARLKADSLEPRTTTSISAVEQAAKMRALEAEAKKTAAEKATQQAIEDAYYTVRVGNTGMTQAQLDAQANAIETARLIGGTTVVNPAGGLTVVGPKGTTTPPPTTTPGGKTAEQIAAEKAAADKAAADKIAADKAAADAARAAAEKVAAESAAAQKAAEAALAAAKTAAEVEAAKTAARLADEQKAAAEKALADLIAKTAADAKAAADKAAADLKAAEAAGDAKAAEAARIAAANAKAAADAAALASAQATATANAAESATLTNVSGNVALPIAGTTAADIAAKAQAEQAKLAMRESTIKILTDRFNKYNLGSLANKIRDLAIDGATESTITLDLQETDEYQMRFKANQERIKKGLQVLNPAEYLNLEDGYRQVLRAYGLKEFDTDDYVSQFIANDVSAAELSNRVVTAVQRVQNADPALIKQLDEFYGIKSDRLVAYVLDPNQQFQKIERQIAAGEIGVAAQRQGLQAGVQVAEQLAAQGITEAEARRGYATIADILPTAEKLSDIYGTTLDPYGQSEGEQEVFNQLASAQRKRQRLTAREVAAFSGAAGVNRTSLTSPTAGQY